jgi:Glycosyltransferase family 28 C-terminal domain/Monogalactosyldiacylglycerol (MGDG) synthase
VKRLDFVFFDAGGGHRSAANALKSIIEQQGRPWEVRLIDLQDILGELDVIRKFTGICMEDVYNQLLKKGWTLGSPQLLVAMHLLIRVYHGGQVRLLKRFWPESSPDLVVSLVPNFNRALFESLHASRPSTPLVTVLTDLADYPPHFWMERQPQYYICGTEKAAGQAESMGHPKERVFRTSGMILRPSFYQPIEACRTEERRKLGLDPNLPTGCVLFGGEGSEWMIEITRILAKAGLPLQLILICGKNNKLKQRLEDLRPGFPVSVVGFTSEIPYYMHLSDFFIGKPGPGSISEAIAMGLPVVVERNAWTLPQERYNADWIREKGLGVVLKSFRDIEAGLRELLEPANLDRYRRNAAAIENRAVFEIPEILEQLL